MGKRYFVEILFLLFYVTFLHSQNMIPFILEKEPATFFDLQELSPYPNILPIPSAMPSQKALNTPPVGNQGPQGACACWALSNICSIKEFPKYKVTNISSSNLEWHVYRNVLGIWRSVYSSIGSSLMYSPISAGTYQVVVRNPNACEDYQTAVSDIYTVIPRSKLLVET